jgi:enolase
MAVVASEAGRRETRRAAQAVLECTLTILVSERSDETLEQAILHAAIAKATGVAEK